jgi:hypothetical protein
LTMSVLTRGQDFYVSSANINYQHVHDVSYDEVRSAQSS